VGRLWMAARCSVGYPVRLKHEPGVWQLSKVKTDHVTVWSAGHSKRVPNNLGTPVTIRHPVFAAQPVVKFGSAGNPEVTELIGSFVEFPPGSGTVRRASFENFAADFDVWPGRPGWAQCCSTPGSLSKECSRAAPPGIASALYFRLAATSARLREREPTCGRAGGGGRWADQRPVVDVTAFSATLVVPRGSGIANWSPSVVKATVESFKYGHLAGSSLTTYGAAWRIWGQYCAMNGWSPFPDPGQGRIFEDRVLAFLVSERAGQALAAGSVNQ
jgi:hypothetical protein